MKHAKRRPSRKVAAACALAAGLAVAGVGVRYGTSQASSGASTTIYGCVSAKHAFTRVTVKALSSCPAGTYRVSWAGTVLPGPVTSATSPAPTPTSTVPSPTPTAPKPTPTDPKPTPTDPTPTPTLTTPAPAGSACVTSSVTGSCGPYTYSRITGSSGNDTFVINNIWNDISGAAQTLTASNPGDWSVRADMPAGNTAVVSYPDTQQIYTTTADTPDPMSAFSSITSTYTEAGPGSGNGNDYEAAYDIWAGTGSDNYAQEIMVWVDNHGQRPAGNQVATATIDGASYQVWSTGSAGSTGDPVSLVLNSNETSGTVNVLADLNWLESNGYMPAGSGLNQIDFGYEICSTGGVPETFTLSGYSLTSG
jgi:hypothetical protein